MKLIVGLGNPDSKYQYTRHNVGFMALDFYAQKKNITFKGQRSFKGEIYMGNGFILLKPFTYMNLSGESVALVKNYYKIEDKDVFVISDDFNLEFGKLRLREKGSAGGHNGLKSIISCIGSEDFYRLRVGIGDPEDNAIDFVLGKFKKEELETLESLFDKTNDIIDAFIRGESTQVLLNILSR
ncbi:MAG: aminoacyl-tRNA hydrolase [Gammaproteobacteria bacterium]|nr:aminoacyl-tRNA hydrolase [Gammaproteobacteria bacterium]